MSGALQVFLVSLTDEPTPSQDNPPSSTALEVGSRTDIRNSIEVAIQNADAIERLGGGMVTMLKAMAERGHLNGEWIGESVDTAGVQTEWADASFSFAMILPDDELAAESSLSTSRGTLRFTGSGVSLWRSQRIPFDVSGSVDMRSGAAVVTKQHTGAFTNKLEYSGVFLVVPLLGVPELDIRWAAAANRVSEATVSNEAQRQQRAGALLLDYVEALRNPLYGDGESPGHQPTLPSEAEVEVAIASYELMIVGVYPQGRLRLRKRLAASPSSSSTRRHHDNSESTNYSSADGAVVVPLSEEESQNNYEETGGMSEEESHKDHKETGDKSRATKVNRLLSFAFHT